MPLLQFGSDLYTQFSILVREYSGWRCILPTGDNEDASIWPYNGGNNLLRGYECVCEWIICVDDDDDGG